MYGSAVSLYRPMSKNVSIVGKSIAQIGNYVDGMKPILTSCVFVG